MRFGNRFHRTLCIIFAVAMLIIAVTQGGWFYWVAFAILACIGVFARPSAPPPANATAAHKLLHYFGLRR